MGIRNAFIGTAVFILLNMVYQLFWHGLSSNPTAIFTFFFFLFLLLNIFVIMPAFISGVILTILLQYDHTKGKLSKKVAALKGMLLGVMATSGIILIIYYLLYVWLPALSYHFQPPDKDTIMNYWTAEAIILSFFVGGYTGVNLVTSLSNRSKHPADFAS